MALEVTNLNPSIVSGIGAGAPLSFDVTGTPSTYVVIVETGGVRQLAWDGSGFAMPFAGSSSRVAISGGYRYTIRRSDGRWPSYPAILVRPLEGPQLSVETAEALDALPVAVLEALAAVPSTTVDALAALSDTELAAVPTIPTFNEAATPSTAPLRTDAGALVASAHLATDGTRTATLAASSTGVGVVGDSTVVTVVQSAGPVALVRTGDARLIVTDDGATVAIDRWVTGAWDRGGSLEATGRGLELRGVPVVRLVGTPDYGVDIYTGDTEAVEDPPEETIRLSVAERVLYARDEGGASVALNRTRPLLASSGTVTLTYDRHHVLSGTATASALPAATASDVGRTLAISNRTTGTLTISRAGSDTIDGAASFALAAGSKVVFEVVAAGDWSAWG